MAINVVAINAVAINAVAINAVAINAVALNAVVLNAGYSRTGDQPGRRDWALRTGCNHGILVRR
jgi:hypothetical protein